MNLAAVENGRYLALQSLECFGRIAGGRIAGTVSAAGGHHTAGGPDECPRDYMVWNTDGDTFIW